MATQRFEYFFDLPTELRTQILSYLCLFPGGILLSGGAKGESIPAAGRPITTSTFGGHFPDREGDEAEDGQEQESADPPLDLFLASSVLYREAGDLYYGGNDFHVDFATPFCYSFNRRRRRRNMVEAGLLDGSDNDEWKVMDRGVGQMLRLLTSVAAENARWRIRSVVLYVRRFGGIVLDVMVPTMAVMVMKGGLRRVRVDMVDGKTNKTTAVVERKDVDLSKNRALRGLLVLLTDPDLQKAELRVPKGVHSQFWCQFHRGGGAEGCAVEDDDDFLEVDIHGVVQACVGDAAEFNIVKVWTDSSSV